MSVTKGGTDQTGKKGHEWDLVETGVEKSCGTEFEQRDHGTAKQPPGMFTLAAA